MTPAEKAAWIKSRAEQLGFDRAGITPADRLAQAGNYRAWLAAGYAGSMGYLHRNVSVREDPRELLPGARSILCVAANYRRPAEEDGGEAEPGGRVAQYARGRDYHLVLRDRLNELVADARVELGEPFEARVCVDTAPLLERPLAAMAGLGWIGKHTLLLDSKLGSFLFLAEVVTTLDLPPDAPATDHCGTCTRCLDACPTKAFPAPYVLDATRCIAYLTIEHRGEIEPALARSMSDWVFGCDVCQDVCPFNRRAPESPWPEFRERRVPARLPLAQLVEMASGENRRMTAGSAAARASAAMWRRNARIALANSTSEKPSPAAGGSSDEGATRAGDG